MAKNFKNEIRDSCLRNFTTKVKTRYILIDRKKCPIKNIDKRVKTINDIAHLLIQDLNLLINDRQLPYISLEIQSKNSFSKRARAFIHDDQISADYEKDLCNKIVQDEELSHIIEILVANGFKKIVISKIGCDAEIIIDYHFLDAVITDIVLDIIMFNSYSFLKAMTIKEKREFSQQKYKFFVDNKLPCLYDYKNEKPLYYSLAFSARRDSSTIDLEYYISLWDKFIETYYCDKKHIEKSVKEQLSQHIDKGELPKSVHRKFDNYSQGAYLLLRTNKDRTEKIHPQLYNLFGIKKFRKGKLRIVPISDFEKYKPLLKNLDVSAFKIVIQ